MSTTTSPNQKLLRPGEFETELRKVADSLYTQPGTRENPIVQLLSNTLDIEAARRFWARHWHVEQAYNQYLLSRLMEGCPDVDARVQIFDVISGEWGRGDPSRAYPELYRRFLLGLGVPPESVPWEYDVQRADVVSHLQRWDSSSWLELLVGELLGVKTMAPKVYRAIAEALLAAPYSLAEPDVVFFRTHEKGDANDCDIVFELVARYAVTVELQEQARRALRAFGTESRFAPYCCLQGATTYEFEAQPGGIPLRLRDATPRMRSKPTIA
jgi:pyrroloquinoline quinone (PQQ) biosynthesis protein C